MQQKGVFILTIINLVCSTSTVVLFVPVVNYLPYFLMMAVLAIFLFAALVTFLIALFTTKKFIHYLKESKSKSNYAGVIISFVSIIEIIVFIQYIFTH